MRNIIVSFVLDLIEDDPFPYEINHFYFFLSNGYLGLGGRELMSYDIINFDYYPLEAQCCLECKKIFFGNDGLIKLKLLLMNALENKAFKRLFAHHHIHIGYLNYKISYSFEI